MDKQFLERKLRELNDYDLIELIQSGAVKNEKIFQLVRQEAIRRNLDIPDADTFYGSKHNCNESAEDLEQLKKWNWAAFMFVPVWTLANKLEKWTVLFFIPVVNFFVMFYMGYKGNRLAFARSNIRSVSEFMKLQEYWNKWGLRFFWITIGGVLLYYTLSYIFR